MTPLKYFVIGYFAMLNILAFILYAIDKIQAIRHKKRIPWGTLLGISLIGGGVGGFLGMGFCNHMTRKEVFWTVNALSSVAWSIALLLLIGF